MAQIFDPVPSDRNDRILCCYVNATNKIQIARIANIPNWYFERVVFPGQRLMFEALPYAQLEIHSGVMASAILSDKIPCERLSIEIDPNLEQDAVTHDVFNPSKPVQQPSVQQPAVAVASTSAD